MSMDELIYDNRIARSVESMGYLGIATEGTEKILGWRSPNFVYRPVNTQSIGLLMKNYKLSDDIAFRFSNRAWEQWPLTADKFARWVDQINGHGQVCNLFMDYETIGEHQWADTGIFDFIGIDRGDSIVPTFGFTVRNTVSAADAGLPFASAGQRNLLLVKGADFRAVEDNGADHLRVLQQRHAEQRAGEVVALFVVRKDPALTAEQLLDFCKHELTAYKKPKYIEFRDELPKTNVGKILRRQLRDEKQAA